MDMEQVFLRESFMSLPAIKLLPHLLARDYFNIDGTAYCPTFDDGLCAFRSTGFSGFIWPYVPEGHSVADPIALWFALPHFSAPARWVSHLLYVQSSYFHRNFGEDNDELPNIREFKITDDIAVREFEHSNPGTNQLLRQWRTENARQFLLLGRLDPNDATLILSDLPLPDPLTWSFPGAS